MRTVLAGLAAMAALALLAPSAAAAEPVVRSGHLSAAVTPDPWHLAFAGPFGHPLLEEAQGTAGGPTGTLGFSTAGGWRHATRVVAAGRDGDAYTATLATTDPLGRRLAVRLAPEAEGVVRLDASVIGGSRDDVSATGAAFDSSPGERFLGFGERSNAVDQRGREVESYVAEGPYQPAEQPFIAAFVPPAGYRPREDATYFPIPWLLSTRGYGVLVGNDETSRFRLGTERADAWSVEADGPRLTLHVIAGPQPADVLRRFTALVGRQPPAAAPFYFGPWYQPAGDDASSLAALRHADAPASVAQTYTHYLPCGDQQGNRDAQRARTKAYHAAGLAVTTYFNPMICTGYSPRYEQASSRGLLTRNPLGQPYLYRYTGSTQFLVGQFDFTQPAAGAFYGDLLGEALADGYDGWMEDFGEYTPEDARGADGSTGSAGHNRYPLLYHHAAYAFSRTAPRPLARFDRSGWTGTARVSQIVWGGDPTTDWGFDGLASALTNGLTMGLSGVSLWGSDIGGFFTLAAPQLTPELLVRWIELGFGSGVMRTQANGFNLTSSSRRPQIFDPGVLPTWRRYAKLRTQLYPYLSAAEAEYDHTGLPLMRQLALAYPHDPAAAATDDAYLLGPNLLVAPVLTPGGRSRRLHLPPGHWVDLWRSAATRRDGSLRLGRARVLSGPSTVTLPAPLEELPLLAHAGTVLALLPADVWTLADYGGPGVVRRHDREDRRSLLAWPRDASAGSLGAGEPVESLELRDGWRLRLHGRRTRLYDLQAALGAMRRPFRPCRVTVGGRALSSSGWGYDAAAQVLHATFRLRAGDVVVTGC